MFRLKSSHYPTIPTFYGHCLFLIPNAGEKTFPQKLLLLETKFGTTVYVRVKNVTLIENFLSNICLSLVFVLQDLSRDSFIALFEKTPRYRSSA